MKTGRRKSTSVNIFVTFLYQLITILIGFIIPQLFLNTYGPRIHGLTSSISNVMSYVLLLNAGLNTASVEALYEPIAKYKTYDLNAKLNAIKRQYILTGFLYIIAILIIALTLPVTIDDMSYRFVFAMVIVMGLQSTMDSFLISYYRILLQADQKLYINNFFIIGTQILRGIFQVILILNNTSPIIVQSVPGILILLHYILLLNYVKKNYPFLDKNVPRDESAISKRWSALIHQISGLILNNMDIILLTIVSGNMILVSIYSVYELVFNHLYSMLKSIFSTAIVASFGNLIATKELKTLRNSYNIFEFIYYSVVVIVYSIAGTMILPFVRLYTSGVSDIPYIDVNLAILFVIRGILNSLKVPGNTLIDAAGLFKETQSRAILEALINVTLSIILIKPLGMYGLLFAAIGGFVFRLTDFIIYTNKNILLKTSSKSFFRVLIVLFNIAISILIYRVIFSLEINNWITWLFSAFISGLISLIIVLVTSTLFEFKLIKSIVNEIKAK
ncbi:hypothetical protein HYO62_09610 [Aerococcaceae bacterium DSM 111022]|nr:hypothetical protein [Aerococcaceae bacterium DSM 111022]